MDKANINRRIILKIRAAVIVAGMFLILPIAGFCDNEPSKSRADRHPLIHKGVLNNPFESLIIGNGDVAISAQMFSHQLILQIGKNDIWDSRSEYTTDELLLTQDKLIEVNGKPVAFTKKGRDIVFRTQPNMEYELTYKKETTLLPQISP